LEEDSAADNDEGVRDKPEFVSGFRFDFGSRLLSACTDELFTHIWPLTKFFRGVRYLLTNSRLPAKPIAGNG
jgi:hypothetical protein